MTRADADEIEALINQASHAKTLLVVAVCLNHQSDDLLAKSNAADAALTAKLDSLVSGPGCSGP